MGPEFAYPGFNGRIAKVLLRIGPGSHIVEAADFAKYLENIQKPDTKVVNMKVTKIIEGEVKVFTGEEEPEPIEKEGEET